MNKLINKSDRIFIAGHNGMVGSAIVRCLSKHGFGEKGIGRILTVSREEVDLTDYSSINNWIIANKPTIVIIAAAKVGGIKANYTFPTDFLLNNLKIQNNIIESAWRNQVKRLCFLGSSCIYPKFASQPIVEDSLLTGALEPTNEPYAIAKIAGIKLLEALRRQYNFDSFSLIPTNLYGPGDNYHPQNSHVMAAFIRRFCSAANTALTKVTCWGTGRPRREFLHVDDLAEAVLFCLQSWKYNCEEPSCLNVGTGSDLSIKELAYTVASQAGFNGDIFWDESKPDGTPQKLLDISRLSSKGWKAQISLEEGIRGTIESWQRSQSHL